LAPSSNTFQPCSRPSPSMIKKSTMKARVNRVAKKGSFLITTTENLLYLAGTDAAAAMLVPSEGDPLLLATRMEAERALSESWVEDVRAFQPGKTSLRRAEKCIFNSPSGALLELLTEKGIDHVSYDSLPERLAAGLGSTKLRRSDLVERMRMKKSHEEIRMIERAKRIAEEAYEVVSSDLDQELTEMDLAGRIYSVIMSRGAKCSFDPIVAFEESSAFPHHPPGKKRIGRSSVILLDLGARVDGYCSDITRTILASPGPAEESLEKVRATIADVADSLTPGMKLSEADALARESLGKEDRYFLHSLGHGLGLAIHEAPVLSPQSDDVLEEGMVFTVEPGLYYRGRYGVRWEEDFACWKGRVRML